MSLEDPRHYLNIQPVPPWSAAKDAKLKARSFNQYNLGSPTRLDMFRMNYSRRLRQLTSQGFMSSSSKPYQPVGTLILNVKDLVKKTLGQEKDQHPKSTKVLSKENIPSSNHTSMHDADKPKPASSSSRPISSRSQNRGLNLQDIATNLNMVESTKHSVKLGHSLFNILETSESLKLEPKHNVEIKDVQAKNSNDDMKIVSVTSETDAEFQQGAKALPAPQFLFKIDQCQLQSTDKSREMPSDFSYKAISHSDKNQKNYQLWRQLCALHWLIEACRHEQGLSEIVTLGEHIVPLAECWNTVHPGGMADANSDRYMGTSWRSFSRSSFQTSVSLSRSNSQCSGTVSTSLGFLSPASPKRHKDAPNAFEHSRTPSVFSISPGHSTFRRSSIDNRQLASEYGKNVGSKETHDNDNESDYHNNLVKLLDTVKESVSKEMLYREKIAEDEAEMKGRLKVPVYKWALTPYPKPVQQNYDKKKSVVVEDQTLPSKKPTVHIRPHTAGPTLQNRRAVSQASESFQKQPRPQTAIHSTNKLKRPRSSPPKLSVDIGVEFQSANREQTMIKMKEQFQEVTNLKALRLHQNLTELQRSQWERMEKKFEAFHVRQRGMHRNLKVMRSAVAAAGSGDRNGSRLSSPAVSASTCEWYSQLLKLTLAHESEDKPCMTVMKRLEESAARCMGWMSPDVTSRSSPRLKDLKRSNAPIDNQITVESFVTVLRQLRSFEIFAPDVSAAVEFMRKEVVKMPQEQFEDVIKKIVI
ncbi:uncharacterized protein LOC120339960 [Styela clava]